MLVYFAITIHTALSPVPLDHQFWQTLVETKGPVVSVSQHGLALMDMDSQARALNAHLACQRTETGCPSWAYFYE